MAASKDFYRNNGANAATRLIGQGLMQEGYPTSYGKLAIATNGSWQAMAWKEGFDRVRNGGTNNLQILRVETSNGWGMYSNLWFECDLPNDYRHPTVGNDSLYQANLKAQLPNETWEPRGHRFGFLDLTMLRNWIYNDKWLTMMGEKGAVICVYEVPAESVIIGRTQVTFDHEQSVCISRKPLASLLEQA